MTDLKRRGRAVLNRVSEFVGLKDKLIGIRNKVKEGTDDTNRIIAKIDSFGKDMREAGQKIANTFRTFADKEEVDYSEKEQKFSKTEVAKNPWQWKKKVYESMVLRLDVAIDKVEDLSRDVELDRMEKKQVDKSESVTDIQEEITPAMSVAEPSEYQYGVEAFEAAYPKIDVENRPEAKAPSVPKTENERWLPMTDKEKGYWAYFLNVNKYYEQCLRCVHDCKKSFYITGLLCKKVSGN